MRRTNPVFIPRNHRVEEAIKAGNHGDYAPFHRLNYVLQHPFTAQSEFTDYEAAPLPNEVRACDLLWNLRQAPEPVFSRSKRAPTVNQTRKR